MLTLVFIYSIIYEHRWYGCLAQLEEHLPYKQRVSGSSPLTPTIIFFEKNRCKDKSREGSEVAKRGRL